MEGREFEIVELFGRSVTRLNRKNLFLVGVKKQFLPD